MSWRPRTPPSGGAIRAIRTTAATIRSSCAANGQTIPTAKRNAPTGGPMIWLATGAALQAGVSDAQVSGSTSIGSSVDDVVSANTSPTPSRHRHEDDGDAHLSGGDHQARPRDTTTRAPSAAITSRRRSTRSATAPA